MRYLALENKLGNMSKYGFVIAAILFSAAPDSLFSQSVSHGTDEVTAAVLGLSGAVYAEDLSEDEVERLEELRSRPVNLNTASRSRLLGTGLFSYYQVASIIDYRTRNGDILSCAELAALDGFSPESAKLFLPFVSFRSFALPGKSSVRPVYVSNSVILKSSCKLQKDVSGGQAGGYSYGIKYKFCMNDMFEAAFTCRTTYDSDKFPPESVSFYMAFHGLGDSWKIVAGDFNARFGQGLIMWSGFSISGVPVQSAFSKRPTGISPYWSYSGEGSHRGIAADFSAGDFIVSAFVSFPGSRSLTLAGKESDISVLPGMNVVWSGADGQVALSCYAASRSLYHKDSDGRWRPVHEGGAFFDNCMVSADARYSLRGTELFAEAALDALHGIAAALAGCKFSPWKGLYLATGLRYYPAGFMAEYAGAMRSGTGCSNEYGISVSGMFSSGKYVKLAGKTGFASSAVRHQGSFSVDLSRSPEPKYGVHEASSQCKAVFSYVCQLSPVFSMGWKLSERLRSYGDRTRTDIRCDFRFEKGGLISSVRLDALRCKGLGMLSYLEAGYKAGRIWAYLRGGLFRVDNWSDRIYAYERDAPGNFTVPAYYGRGFWAALVSGAKAGPWGRFYVRVSYTGYPWKSPSQKDKKPGRAELKFQMVFDL